MLGMGCCKEGKVVGGFLRLLKETLINFKYLQYNGAGD
jgi:hypothetical protein